uniref:Uncharacterized protein n=1 Tax=Spongospora subterranea TaxID=70186 RepID=A0A0H5R4V1_9EUKA|eukprot:CRZ08916.1 hypothetical protein [Spongospora subterranea]
MNLSTIFIVASLALFALALGGYQDNQADSTSGTDLDAEKGLEIPEAAHKLKRSKSFRISEEQLMDPDYEKYAENEIIKQLIALTLELKSKDQENQEGCPETQFQSNDDLGCVDSKGKEHPDYA